MCLRTPNGLASNPKHEGTELASSTVSELCFCRDHDRCRFYTNKRSMPARQYHCLPFLFPSFVLFFCISFVLSCPCAYTPNWFVRYLVMPNMFWHCSYQTLISITRLCTNEQFVAHTHTLMIIWMLHLMYTTCNLMFIYERSWRLGMTYQYTHTTSTSYRFDRCSQR